MVERIEQLIKHLEINDWKFANEIKVNYKFFDRFFHWERNIQVEELQKILQRWPEVNARWLILGEGEMLN